MTDDALDGAVPTKHHSWNDTPIGTAEIEGLTGRSSASSSSSSTAKTLFKVLKLEHRRLSEDHCRLADPTTARILSHLDRLQAQDLGVSSADVKRLRGRSGIGYQEVYSGPEMTLCIFLLRAGASIPLHDHPNMYVFCRLLFGRLRVVSYDPEKSPSDGVAEASADKQAADARYRRLFETYPQRSCFASFRGDEVLGPEPATCGLTPDEGNVHELHALEDCAFFDVVAPPYDHQAGRDCTYFARDEVLGDVKGRCILVPTIPTDFSTEHCEYRGPVFQD